MPKGVGVQVPSTAPTKPMEHKREIDLCAYKWETYEEMVPKLIDTMKGHGYADFQIDWIGDGFIIGRNDLPGIKEVAHREIIPTSLNVIYYLRLRWKKENFVMEATLQDEGREPYWIFTLRSINYHKGAQPKGPIFLAECAFFYERDLAGLTNIENNLKRMTLADATKV